MVIKGIENGKITFDVTYVTPPDEEAPRIRVAMTAPSGAASCWNAYDSSHHEELRFENGIAYIEDFYPDFAQNTRVDERTYTIIWKDTDGNVMDYGILWTYVVPTENDPWACYVENWHAADPTRVTMVNGAASCGVEMTYNSNNGVMHVGYNNTVSISETPGDLKVYLTPYPGAACYRSNGSGSNVIMGKDDWNAKEQHFVVTEQDYIMLEEDADLTIYERTPFREVDAGPVTVYIQEGAVWEYGGGVTVIYWYASEEAAINAPENPMYIEYICDTNDVLCVEKRIPVESDESKITSPVKEITAVGNYPWNLVVRRYPQKGSNAFHWELHMENETGAYQPLTGSMIFYVPYPSGHNNHTVYTYELRHYDDEHSSFSLVDARRTEYGLRFEISSLSPFVLSWNKSSGISSVLTLPAGLKSIGESAFMGLNIQQVVLPDGISSIESGAFANCTSLVTINLPDSLDFIADDAFSGCGNFTAIVSEGSMAYDWCVRKNIAYDIK